ncbi:ribosomal protein S16 [Ascobolus immersus RN42]|uniref:Ribosomal protein S16 n=1 Tax=Ascobolus immersus RN42 TaxID=1160509 RepID=A0A3N4IK33_ASCIM|nr:ribosomal protein S16 [Ascobolus immersus RN42]
MVIRLRLARFGRKHRPVYNIVVMQARSARNSKPIEVIGTYDPIPRKPENGEDGKPFKDIQLDVSRAKYWLGVGAQPSDPVWRLLSMFGALEPRYKVAALSALNPDAAKPHPAAKDLLGKTPSEESKAVPKLFTAKKPEKVAAIDAWMKDPSVPKPPVWGEAAKAFKQSSA